ncbi:MAG: hypothetical protein FWE69_02395 [Clostridiales bacterium]|nr:hypothetical protein [Clostridiales bacterium]
MKKTTCFLLALFLALSFSACVSKQSRYDEAKLKMDAGEYELAREEFLSLEDFEDSAAQARACKEELSFIEAQGLAEAEDWEAARVILEGLMDREDAEALLAAVRDEISYLEGLALAAEEKFEEAAEVFRALKNFKDSRKLLTENTRAAKQEKDYQAAVALLDAEDYVKAYEALEELDNYKDVKTLLRTSKEKCYDLAVSQLENGENYKAFTLFKALDDYKDCKLKIKDCILPMPKTGIMEKNISGSAQLRITCTDPDAYVFLRLYATDGSLAQSAFVKGKGKVTMGVPGGTYTLHIARAQKFTFRWGDLLGDLDLGFLKDFDIEPDWFGPEDMFGENAYYGQVKADGNPDGSFTLKNNYYLPFSIYPVD